jgi:hypothetical protein
LLLPTLKHVAQGQAEVLLRGGGGAQWRANQLFFPEGMMMEVKMGCLNKWLGGLVKGA